MELPSWCTYCDGTTKANALRFDLGPLRVWFSYKTPMAFRTTGGGLVVRENDWGPTTGKHLNAIDGGTKATRIPGDEFERQLQVALQES